MTSAPVCEAGYSGAACGVFDFLDPAGGGYKGGGGFTCDTGITPWVATPAECALLHAPIFLLFAPPPGQDAPPIARSLGVVNDCYWASGIGITVGKYTRQIEYQILDQYGQPFYGSEVPTITESVFTISGPTITGGGVWSRANNTSSPNGTFADYLSYQGPGPSTAAQMFSAGSPALGVNVGGAGGNGSVLVNTYSKDNVTINGKSSPRPCADKDKRL
jgi:hypothetical protein